MNPCRRRNAESTSAFGSVVAVWLPEVAVSCNVAPRQILHGRVVDDVRAALSVAGLAPERLTLEITENAMVGDSEMAIARLDEVSRPRLSFPAHFLEEAQKASYPALNVNGRSFARSIRS